MNLSQHFSLEEFTVSQEAERRGIRNDPPPMIVENLRRLAKYLEEVRVLLGSYPILINSGYRSAELNVAVGGSKASAHMNGLAADFICPLYGSPRDVGIAIIRSRIQFDQCILEFGRWVHFGLSETEPRNESLTAKFEAGRTIYEYGIA